MLVTLSENHAQLKRAYIGFAQQHLNGEVAARDREGRFEVELWQKCGEQLLHGLPIPADFGGQGFSALETVIALEGLGYGCEDGGLVFALGAQLFSCTVPIWLYGSAGQKDRYLGKLCQGKLIATSAMTEAEGGSAAFQMQSRGERHDGSFHLSGVKTFCANAPVADLCLAYVLTDPVKGFMGGVSGFLLDRVQHGYQVAAEVEKIGLRTCTTGSIDLGGVTVLAGDALGGPGGGGPVFNRAMEWERIGLSAINVGTMTRLLERVVEFAKQRKPGGSAIIRNQAVTHTLAEIQTSLEAGKLLVYQAAQGLDQAQNMSAGASITKLFVSELFKSMTVKLMQIHASAGYQVNSEIGRVLQDALASTLYSGTSEVQRNIIARWMGC